MRDRLWLFLGLALGVAFAIQVAMPVDFSETPETSFETAPRGHAALFELLTRFGAVRGRWLSGLAMPPVEDTVWWIAAPDLCDDEVQGEESKVGTPDELETSFHSVTIPWIEAGGTAIVWLSHPPIHRDIEALPEDVEGDVETRNVSFRRSAMIPASLEGRRPETRSGSDTEGEGPEDESLDDEGAEPPRDAESIREEWHADLDESRREIREGEARGCSGIAGFDLPPRLLAGLEENELPRDADYSETAFSVGRWVEAREHFDYAAARLLPGSTLAFFERNSIAMEGWTPLWVEADDFTPFTIERQVGKGLLVVVADARIVTNRRLGRGDSAPLIFDFIDVWGQPWIDEHIHGVVPESGTFRYLATSPAWAVGIGLILLGGLSIWRGNSIPQRLIDEVDPDAPSLEIFVDNLAGLYAGTGDHVHAFERYRELSLERIRRALGLSVGVPVESILAGMRARAKNSPAQSERGLRDLLMSDLQIENVGELKRAAGRLDALVEVLLEENFSGNAARRNRT